MFSVGVGFVEWCHGYFGKMESSLQFHDLRQEQDD